MNLKNKRILITGADSFLGKSLVPLIRQKGAEPLTFSFRDYDLRLDEDVKKLFENFKPEIVIHLAADCGGNKYIQENPGSILYNNIMINTLVQEYSMRNGVEKFVGIGSIASYPKNSKPFLKEEALWEGYPEKIQAPYGIAKKVMLVQSQAYRKQYGFNAIHILPTNLYGPNCPLDSKNIRVIPLFIRKFLDAKGKNEKKIKLSGTKNSRREFLYIEDCAKGIIQATELYDKPEPMNLGTGKSISIQNLAEKIKKIVGFCGEISWEEISTEEFTRPVSDISKAKRVLGFKAKTSLSEGLKKTIQWCLSNKIVKN